MTTGLQKSSQETLKRVVAQIERLDEERKGIVDDINDKIRELKLSGFDVKAVRKILRMRKQSQTEREEEEAIIETYMASLGMLTDTPLGEWATNTQVNPWPS